MKSVGDIVIRKSRYMVKESFEETVVLDEIGTGMTLTLSRDEYNARFRPETYTEQQKSEALYFGIGDAVDLIYKKHQVSRLDWDGGTHIAVYVPAKSNKVNTAFIYLAKVVNGKVIRSPWVPTQEDLCASDYYVVKRP